MELLLSRSWLIRVCNLCLYLAFCAAAGSGLVMEYRLPRGRSHRGLELLGLDRHEWGSLHFYPKFRSCERRFVDLQALTHEIRRFSPLHFAPALSLWADGG
jgi:hypothetical protein